MFLSLFVSALLFSVTSLAYASAPPRTRETTTHADLLLVNLTSSDNLQAPVNATGDEWSWYCTQVPGWISADFNPDDCMGVLDYFFMETMHDGGKNLIEFLMPGSKKSLFVKTQWTPRKYTFGTCTLAIVIIKDFPDPASLPGGSKTGPDSDSSTYSMLWRTAENLVQQCVQHRGEMGWQTAGLEHGLGVFIWATGSDQDLAIEADEARFTIPVRNASEIRSGVIV